MNRFTYFAPVVLGLGFLLAGCGNSQPKVQPDASQVFVRVGGRTVTAQSVSNTVMVLAEMRKLSTGKMLSPKQFPYWANAKAMKIIPSLVAAERLDLYLISNGVHRTETSDRTVLGRYNRQLRKDYPTPEALFAGFGPLAGSFEQQFARESRQEACYESNPACTVLPRDRDQYYASYSNAVAAAKNYNVGASARAADICARLKAGEDWDVVAQAETDEGKDEDDTGAKDFWKFWEVVTPKYSDMPEVAAAVSLLKPGEWTRPIETDDGIVIAKLLGKDDQTGGYRCARILIYQAIAPVELSGVALNNYLLRRKRAAFQKSIREELVRTYPSEYVLGTNFTYKIWHEDKPLKRGFNRL